MSVKKIAVFDFGLVVHLIFSIISEIAKMFDGRPNQYWCLSYKPVEITFLRGEISPNAIIGPQKSSGLELQQKETKVF